MVGHGGSSAGSYLAHPTSPIPSHCASIVATSTLRVNSLHAMNIVAVTHDLTCMYAFIWGFSHAYVSIELKKILYDFIQLDG